MPLLSVKRNRNIISGKKHREQKSMYYRKGGEGEKTSEVAFSLLHFLHRSTTSPWEKETQTEQKIPPEFRLQLLAKFQKKGILLVSISQ